MPHSPTHLVVEDKSLYILTQDEEVSRNEILKRIEYLKENNLLQKQTLWERLIAFKT